VPSIRKEIGLEPKVFNQFFVRLKCLQPLVRNTFPNKNLNRESLLVKKFLRSTSRSVILDKSDQVIGRGYFSDLEKALAGQSLLSSTKLLKHGVSTLNLSCTVTPSEDTKPLQMEK
jgi:hypothetical protein